MSKPNACPARSLSPALLPAALVAAVLLAPEPVRAQDTVPPLPAQREHTVRPGDTLWDLARAYLQDPFLWPLLFDANRNLLRDPDLIVPTQRLIIPVTKPGEAAPEPLPEPVMVAPPPAPADTAPAQDTTALGPLAVRPGEYASAPWLSDTAALAIAGRVVRLADPAQRDERLLSTLHPYDRVYVGQLRGLPVAVGDSLLMVRLEDAPRGWGRMVMPVAVLEVDTLAGAVLGARVVRQYADAREGDHALLGGNHPAMPRGEPAAVENGPTGTIVTFARPRTLQSTTNVGFVDLGGASGIGLGDVFEAYARAGEAYPWEPVARLRVIRVEPASATVLVTSLASIALKGGLPVRLVRRMQ